MRRMIWQRWLVVTSLVLAVHAPAQAEDATLDLAALIKGIEGSDVWQTHKSWLVKYTNARTRIHPPPKAMVEWPDAELVNARKGDWLLAHVRQPAINQPALDRPALDQPALDQPKGVVDHWMLWRDGKFTDRIGSSVQTGQEPLPMGSYFWYPNSLMREGLLGLLKVPKEAYASDPELSRFLPFCLRADQAAYQVRKELEEIDGALCHVVERPGHDILWIDAQHGFQLRRRTLFQKPGQLLSEFRATDVRERAPGVWLPTRQLAVAYNMESDPPEYRGRVRFVLTNTLAEARFGELPDDLFVVPAAERR